MRDFKDPLDSRDGYLPAAHGLPTLLPTVRAAALLAVLLAYAVGFAVLYPLAETSVLENIVKGGDPTPVASVAP